MSVIRRARDYALFIGGLMLGILGNLLAEFLIAFCYPNGTIPPDKAEVSITILSVAIIVDVFLLGTLIMVRLPELIVRLA